MINKNISMPEGTKDCNGREIKAGDVLVLRGHFAEDGRLLVDTTSDITTLITKVDLND